MGNKPLPLYSNLDPTEAFLRGPGLSGGIKARGAATPSRLAAVLAPANAYGHWSGEYSRIVPPPRMCANADEPAVPRDRAPQYSKIKVIPLPPHKCEATLCARVIVSSADKKEKLFQARVLNTLRQ